MRGSKTARRAVDIAMTALLPCLMAYSLIGETFHEIAGVTMFVLFVVHHLMHPGWWKSLFHGRYNGYRILNTAINGALCVVMVMLPVSGIVLSKHVFRFLSLEGLSSTARTVHLLLSYWGFCLLCVHAGLHTDAMIRKAPKGLRRVLAVGSGLVSLYGVYAFIRRQIPSYMFLQNRFVFFDYAEPRLAFFADYLAVMILFMTLGFWLGRLLKTRKGNEL